MLTTLIVTALVTVFVIIAILGHVLLFKAVVLGRRDGEAAEKVRPAPAGATAGLPATRSA